MDSERITKVGLNLGVLAAHTSRPREFTDYVRSRIRHNADDGKLELVWQEAGGPSVQPPARSGFGSALLKRVFEHQHSGEVQFDWQPRGLVYRLELPLADVTKDFQAA